MGVTQNPSTSSDAIPQIRCLGTRAEMVYRSILLEAIECSGKTREQIENEMGQLLGRPVPKGFLNQCLKRRKQGRMVRFPAAWVSAFCQVTGQDAPQRHVLSARLLECLEIGENVIEASRPLDRAREAVARIIEQGRQKTKGIKR